MSQPHTHDYIAMHVTSEAFGDVKLNSVTLQLDGKLLGERQMDL